MELMVIIAVIGVLSAIAIPAFHSFIPTMRLNGATRQIMGDLMAARMNAVKWNQKTKVFFNTNGHGYKVCNDADNDDTVDSNEGDVKNRDIEDEYEGVSFSSTGDPIFSPRGTANTGTTITLTNSEGEQKKVKVHSFTGRVKIEDV